MTCYHPNIAHITGIRENGTNIIKFGHPKSSKHEYLSLPCGICIGCRLSYSQQWAVRMMHEAQMQDESAFLTLTYNEENLPKYGTLVPHHMTNFIKRLRKKIATRIRYYQCGEYGESVGNRPHHHICLFGYDFPDKILFSENEGIQTFTSEILENTWQKGFCTTGNLTIESAAYVARYCMKKINSSKESPEKYKDHYKIIDSETGEIIDLQKEYATMSRKPGIGKEWYDKFHSDIFPHDSATYKGRKVSTPRYYEKQLLQADPETHEKIKIERKKKAKLLEHDNTPQRLRVKEIVKIASMANLQRKIHET